MRIPGALPIFLGAFVAFAMEPLVGRTILPEFGGMASVWVTCLAAFQVLLVAGYFYAHRMRAGRVGRHFVLLGVAAAWFAAVGAWWPQLSAYAAKCPVPAVGALCAVLLLGGVPFVLLGANSTLVQVLADGDYRLYAVSNLGSFAGLLAYPFLLEPFLSISVQWYLLSALTVVYALLMRRLGKASRSSQDRTFQPCLHSGSGSRLSSFYWFLIPAATCYLLNAVTAHLTSNVASIPLLWVIVLGAYLVTYVIGFSEIGSRLREVWLWLGVASALVATCVMPAGATKTGIFLQNFGAALALVVFGGSGLHGWLYALRPDKRRLSFFYLAIAVGGAAGGVLSSVLMPLVTRSVLEYPLALACCGVLMVAGLERFRPFPHAQRVLALVMLVCVWHGCRGIDSQAVTRGRSFYGAWKVESDCTTDPFGGMIPCWLFTHGGTIHGLEPKSEKMRPASVAYYGCEGGGLAFTQHPLRFAKKPIRSAIIGLGIGAMAYWGEPGDSIRFYEICPQVAWLAQKGEWFDFLRTCKAKTDVVVADARKALERERAAREAKYDLLVVDAYSGDSIPMHLLTEEAFRLYRDRLTEDGVLALHVSNWHMDLLPACKAAAKLLGRNLQIAYGRGDTFTFDATWAFIAKNPLVMPEREQYIDVVQVPEMALPRDAKGSSLKYLVCNYFPKWVGRGQ